jgi:hypothetical protein
VPGRQWSPTPAVDSADTYSEYDETDNDADLDSNSHSESATASAPQGGAAPRGKSVTSGTRLKS